MGTLSHLLLSETRVKGPCGAAHALEVGLRVLTAGRKKVGYDLSLKAEQREVLEGRSGSATGLDRGVSNQEKDRTTERAGVNRDGHILGRLVNSRSVR